KAADYISLLCRTDDPAPGESRSRGLSTIIIEKERDTFPPGLTGEMIDKIGYHGFLTWNLTFDGLRVPVTNLPGARPRPAGRAAESENDGEQQAGGRGRAFAATQQGLNVARVHTAARAVGLARGALEDCITYLQERVQFERPIGDFQALRFKVAEMAARIEA